MSLRKIIWKVLTAFLKSLTETLLKGQKPISKQVLKKCKVKLSVKSWKKTSEIAGVDQKDQHHRYFPDCSNNPIECYSHFEIIANARYWIYPKIVFGSNWRHLNLHWHSNIEKRFNNTSAPELSAFERDSLEIFSLMHAVT